MNVDKVFKTLSPYLIGLKVVEGYNLVEAGLKRTWVVPPHQSIEYHKNKEDDGITYYAFYTEDGCGFDTILEWLDSEVIQMNIETEKKEQLLREKINDLKNIFESSSLDELTHLSMVVDKPFGLKPEPKNSEEGNGDNDEKIPVTEDGVTEES